MNLDRRDFIKSSFAFTFFSVSKASAQAPKMIGVVTSIRLQPNGDEMQCFAAGLASLGWLTTGSGPKRVNVPAPKEALANYGGTHKLEKIKDAIRAHGPMDLIAAAGGVASRRAASAVLSSPNKPYVYLSGTAPSLASQAGKYCGVILNMATLYPAARVRLVGTPADAEDVWLVQNNNSMMTPAEVDDWQTGFRDDRDFRFFEVPTPQDNPVGNPATAFAQEAAKLAAKNPKGVIVSPDPFFRMEAQAFATAMGAALNVPVCYPFNDFPRRRPPSPPRGGTSAGAGTAADHATARVTDGRRGGALDAGTA